MKEIFLFQTRIEKIEQEIRELSTNSVTLDTKDLELIEYQQVLEKAGQFFSDQEEDQSKALLSGDENRGGQLGFVAGVVQRERVRAFETMLWRVSRGNIFLRRVDLEHNFRDPVTVRYFENNNLFVITIVKC